MECAVEVALPVVEDSTAGEVGAAVSTVEDFREVEADTMVDCPVVVFILRCSIKCRPGNRVDFLAEGRLAVARAVVA